MVNEATLFFIFRHVTSFENRKNEERKNKQFGKKITNTFNPVENSILQTSNTYRKTETHK